MRARGKCQWCGADPVATWINSAHWECGSYHIYSVEMQEGAEIQSINCKRIAGLTAELARVRRSHVRRMMHEAADRANRMMWSGVDTEDREWCRRHAPKLVRFAGACRVALSAVEGKC